MNWDVDSGSRIRTIKTYGKWLSYSPDGEKVLVAEQMVHRPFPGQETQVQLIGARVVFGTNRPVLLQGRDGEINDVAFNHAGTHLAAAGQDGTVKVWSLDQGALVFTLTGHNGPIQCVVFSLNDRRIATAGVDRTVRIWDAENGRELACFRGHTASAYELALSADGDRVASAEYFMGHDDKTNGDIRESIIRVRDINLGQGIFTASLDLDRIGVSRTRIGYYYNYFEVAFGADGSRLLLRSRDGATKRIWDLDTGREAPVPLGRSIPPLEVSEIRRFDYSPDGTRLAIVDMNWVVRAWELSTGQLLLAHEVRPEPVDVNGDGLIPSNLLFSPDGTRLASVVGDESVHVWDMGTGLEVTTLNVQKGLHANLLAFSPNSRRLATATDSGVMNWDLDTRRLLFEINKDGMSLMSFSPDGRRLYVSSYYKGSSSVLAWDADDGLEQFALKGHVGRVFALSSSPDGTRIATAGEDKVIKLWDATTGREILTLRSPDGAVDVSFSPDGRRLLSLGNSEVVRVWNGTPLE